MTDFAYNIVIVPDEDGGFYAFVPDLQGCIGDGDTPQDAVADAMEAATAWIEAQRDRGAEIPQPGEERATLEAEMKEREEYIEKLEADLLEANRKIRTLKAQAAARNGSVGQLLPRGFRAA